MEPTPSGTTYTEWDHAIGWKLEKACKRKIPPKDGACLAGKNNVAPECFLNQRLKFWKILCFLDWFLSYDFKIIPKKNKNVNQGNLQELKHPAMPLDNPNWTSILETKLKKVGNKPPGVFDTVDG